MQSFNSSRYECSQVTKYVIIFVKTGIMETIDLSRPVKFKNPQAGEEDFIFSILNYNEVTNRCIIQAQNLPNWGDALLPTELVSVDDIVNVENKTDIKKCHFKGDSVDILYYIIKENETHFEIVSVDKYELFKRYEFQPERELYSEWIEKESLELID